MTRLQSQPTNLSNLLALLVILLACSHHPPISSEARKILYCADHINKAGNYDGGAVYVVGIDGSEPVSLSDIIESTRLPPSCSAAWSPDGKQVIFVSARDNGLQEVYKVNIDSMRLISLSNSGDYSYNRPQWSPDGELIAFVSDDGIYTMRNDGTELNRVHSYFATDPYWSPDSNRIAFGSIENGEYVINVIQVDGSNLRRVAQTRRNSLYLDWSPDGTRIAFEAIFDNHNYEIAVANADGSGEIRLTNSPGENEHPSWSPDGNQIVFVSNRDGNPEIYKMDANGKNQTRLTHNSIYDIQPEWSPDGKRIAFISGSSGSWEIYTINTDGSARTPITHDSRSKCCLSWQP